MLDPVESFNYKLFAMHYWPSDRRVNKFGDPWNGWTSARPQKLSSVFVKSLHCALQCLSLPGLFNEVGHFLCRHYDDRRRIAVGQSREDTGVHHSDVRHSVYPELVVQDGQLVLGGGHLAGPSLVVLWSSLPTHRASEVLVRAKHVVLAALNRSRVQDEAIFLQCRRVGQLDTELYAVHQYVNIALRLEVMRVHERIVEGIGTVQLEVPPALGYS